MSDEEEIRRYQEYHAAHPGVGETNGEGLTLVDYNEEFKELGLGAE